MGWQAIWHKKRSLGALQPIRDPNQQHQHSKIQCVRVQEVFGGIAPPHCLRIFREESRSHPLAQFSLNAAANSGLPACAPKKPVASTANLRFVVS
jgi:hypothetical protein